MGTFNCFDCRREISSKANTCQHCGRTSIRNDYNIHLDVRHERHLKEQKDFIRKLLVIPDTLNDFKIWEYNHYETYKNEINLKGISEKSPYKAVLANYSLVIKAVELKKYHKDFKKQDFDVLFDFDTHIELEEFLKKKKSQLKKKIDKDFYIWFIIIIVLIALYRGCCELLY